MEERFGSGFRVVTDRCDHRTTIDIFSYASAFVQVNPNGALTFGCNDLTQLFASSIPTRTTMMAIAAVFGMEEMPELPGSICQHNEQTLLFSDEVSLELWLREEFLPGLNVFSEDGPIPEDEAPDMIEQMTRSIMSETLGNQASDQVRRSWHGS